MVSSKRFGVLRIFEFVKASHLVVLGSKRSKTEGIVSNPSIVDSRGFIGVT